MSNGLNPDQARQFVGPDLGQKTVFKSYQQTTLVDKELTSRIEQFCEHGIVCILYDINMWIHHACLIAGSLLIPEM